MLNKQIIKSFFLDFLSSFSFYPTKIVRKNHEGVGTDLLNVEDDINIAYEKLQNDDKRN